MLIHLEPSSGAQSAPPAPPLVGIYANAIEHALDPTGTERSPSRYLSWGRDLETQIVEKAREASVENWDGEGSLPVRPETEAAARRLVRLLPISDLRPTVSVDRDGELEFEWFVARDRVLSLSVGPFGSLTFACLDRVNRQTGRFTFSDRLPPALLLAITDLAS